MQGLRFGGGGMAEPALPEAFELCSTSNRPSSHMKRNLVRPDMGDPYP